ncbi:hypothetical protein [Pseudoalteromonas sp. XMcav11-Q]|uniref:hypothetical protein n=1 Tax=Pseudoalteromonas sp. XMcav11-Q TaxID=3136665 RepID=UPI0032C4AD2F
MLAICRVQLRSSGLELLLCQEHSELYHNGIISEEMLFALAELQTEEVQSSSSVFLDSRERYLGEITRRLNDFTGTLYITYVGPLPLHPLWYQDIRDLSTTLPNMDRLVKKIITEQSNGADYDIKIIFRNSARYIEKVREMTPPILMKKLRFDLLESIDNIFGPGKKQPLFCCSDFGNVRIPTIFMDAAITAIREVPSSPIDSGILITESKILEWEKNSFERIFLGAHRGVHTELNELKNFISSVLV